MYIYVVFACKDNMHRNLCAFSDEKSAQNCVKRLDNWKLLFQEKFHREYNPEDLATAEVQDWLDKNFIDPDFNHYYEKLELK